MVTEKAEPKRPHLNKTEEDELHGYGECAEPLNNFFKDAAQELNKLELYLGPVRYSVQHRAYHDQQHNGHGVWTFVCLRREMHRYLIVPDKRCVLALELSDAYEGGLPFNFAIYTRTHFAQIEEALKPLADILSKETGRKYNFIHRMPDEVPDILSC